MKDDEELNIGLQVTVLCFSLPRGICGTKKDGVR